MQDDIVGRANRYGGVGITQARSIFLTPEPASMPSSSHPVRGPCAPADVSKRLKRPGLFGESSCRLSAMAMDG